MQQLFDVSTPVATEFGRACDYIFDHKPFVDHQTRFLLREFEGKRGDSDAQGLVKLVHQGQRKLSMVEVMMDDVSTSRIDLVLGLLSSARTLATQALDKESALEVKAAERADQLRKEFEGEKQVLSEGITAYRAELDRLYGERHKTLKESFAKPLEDAAQGVATTVPLVYQAEVASLPPSSSSSSSSSSLSSQKLVSWIKQLQL